MPLIQSFESHAGRTEFFDTPGEAYRRVEELRREGAHAFRVQNPSYVLKLGERRIDAPLTVVVTRWNFSPEEWVILIETD
jgi:hypothetical protein